MGRLVWQWADGGSSMEEWARSPRSVHTGTWVPYLCTCVLCSLAGSSRREAKLQWRVS